MSLLLQKKSIGAPLLLVLLIQSMTGYSQALPFDFESTITTSNFVDFDGGVATVIDNPQNNSDNSSEKVAQIVRDGGDIWAGSKVLLTSDLDFSTMNAISMKVFSTAPIGTVVKFKLENASGGNTEKDATTTVMGTWETMTWDFTGTANDLSHLVFMFDFGNTGDGSATSTFLFDDVQQITTESSGSGNSDLAQVDLPVDFEGTTTDYTTTDFGGNISSIDIDPANASNTVIKVIRTTQALLYAGTTIGTPAGFVTDIPLTMEESKMSVLVWSPLSGIPVKLKVENSAIPQQTCETMTLTTVANEWELMTFDFSMEAEGTAKLSTGLENGWKYNKTSIFFNFGATGADAGEQTYYFDDVEFGALASNIDFPEIEGLTIMSNPTIQNWNINSGTELLISADLFDIQGKLLKSYRPNSHSIEISTQGLASGMYVSRLSSKTGISVLKLIKK